MVEDNADQFVDELMDELFGTGPYGIGPGGTEGENQDEDSANADSPPNFWQGPINTGPVSFDKPVDDPVTSGGDGFAGDGVVDTGPSNQQ